jgi:hypothetical protein
MRADIKKLWIDALRSGDYKQYTNGALRKTEKHFCVMGVLCDVTKDITGLSWKYVGGIWYFGCYRGSVPDVISDLCESPTSVPMLRYGRNYPLSLTHLNDIKQISFKKLANLIEEQL